jgi:peptidoglycan L-alanyl-D-glutamate endopeptidase CwlK
MKLNQASQDKLKSVHPDLVKVVERAAKISKLDFVVTEGARTTAQQKINIKKGASQTMRSRHIPSTSQSKLACAVDIAPVISGKVRWDWPLFHILADTMKQAAKDVDVPVEWGGDWRSFKDGPHWQLPWKKYP